MMEGEPRSSGILADPRILQQLPDELVEILRTTTESDALTELSRISLIPKYTTKLFISFEPVFVDVTARWLLSDSDVCPLKAISAFSKILPLAPYLQPFARQIFQRQIDNLPTLLVSLASVSDDMTYEASITLLLSLFRLLSFQRDIFALTLSPAQLDALLSHPDKTVRYLIVRVFCLYMHAADAAMQAMIRKYCGSQPIHGVWEDQVIDYQFLSLWEEQRWRDLNSQLSSQSKTREHTIFDEWIEHLPISSYTANIGGVLVPKVRQNESTCHSFLVRTPTVLENLRKMGHALLSSEPLLLVGQPGVGKTALVTHAANAMAQAATLITLHLNEQTDLKSLLGVYSTSTRSGGFSWQPGSLTRAAREGRWVLIEDLDRAPSEVLSVILPLIKNRELVIPSRKERISCAEDFRIIATMRSTINAKGVEVTTAGNMLGSRLWRHIPVSPLTSLEIRQIIEEEFPLITLARYVDTFLAMHRRITESFRKSAAVQGLQGRSVGLRDLIKFCSRIEGRLRKIGVISGREAIPEHLDDEILLDAVDCFAAYIPNKTFRFTVASVIAEELHVSPQRLRYCLTERIPAYSDDQDGLSIGREFCSSLNLLSGHKPGRSASKSSFASTKASLKTMEQVAAAIQMAEPVLLVGETGIGKTAVIQRLAALLNQRITVVNLSQQSETTDLIGGYKPVNLRSIAVPLVDRFNSLFDATFSTKKNAKFLLSVSKSVTTANWTRLLNILNEAVKMASGLFKEPKSMKAPDADTMSEQPTKKRKVDISRLGPLKQRWQSFARDLAEFETHVSRGDTKVSFAFVQGKIVKALRDGEWVLLDEINLASPETLENISGLLQFGRDGGPSVLLSEAGEVDSVQGHPDFRLFAAMNPATDAGKRDLAPGLRARFTELYVESPDGDLDDLLALIKTYLGSLVHRDQTAAAALANLYLDIKKLNSENKLTDGAGQKPHFSVRTLVRTLFYVIEQAHVYGIRRAIYEGFCMSFLTLLGKDSERLVGPYIDKHLFAKHGNARSMLSQTPKEPGDGALHVQFKHYWMRKGKFEPEPQPHYILTPFIERNLMNLVRACSTRRFPILLQGPTSSGKTSMVEYLAKISGNKFVRINNHEHTDLQEYLGSYVSGEDGSLRYQEGVLVEALRNGYWIVLDELNLAPTDVLEALNRLLDDNRELFLPETQEVVHPHPDFMLFATQNPAGLYGGRKILSRAFRNRFLELHFDDIPEDELEFILKERSQIAPSFCTRIVAVYRQLSILRQSSRLFEQRNSFATLRDLFRWAMRRADDREQLAINGFMLLAERVRNPEERKAVKTVIEKVMGVQIDEESVYGPRSLESRFHQLSTSGPRGIVWTRAMRRLFLLVSTAIEHNEPVLLVGETGCGKTQLCQAVAEAYGKQLLILNAHVNLETGDLIGAQRPLRNRSQIKQELVNDVTSVLRESNAMPNIEEPAIEDLISAFNSLDSAQLGNCSETIIRQIRHNITRSNALFEWSDGILVSAMKSGQHFLLDELSLADDSVLERLNSVLEPHRSLLLAEKGPIDPLVTAAPGFQFLATMNPGGDYGKRELSAALRNRLTEIWVPQLSEADDILPILQAKLVQHLQGVAEPMMDFAKWFKEKHQGSTSSSVSVRDLLAWVDFVNNCKELDPGSAVVHGACLVYVDSLGANPSAILASAASELNNDRRDCLVMLSKLFSIDAVSIYFQESHLRIDEKEVVIGPFSLAVNSNSQPDHTFALDAPTTLSNTLRVARGLQSTKPILLEGSPGVGKTTLVAALARLLGKPLTRINLSEQTDLTDLFGSDVPVEGAEIGNFAWSDAPFLRALQKGEWVLLDEMNLASQSVLEGLNSCLDHRQQVYITELDRTFKRHPNFVLFATQNPHHQGGGRKGLPASFVNRFTVVFADSFTTGDLKLICKRLSNIVPPEQAEQLVQFVSDLNTHLFKDRRLGAIGGPWEVNLRDLSRWLTLLNPYRSGFDPSQFLDIIIKQRFRTQDDRLFVSKLYEKVFGLAPSPKGYFHNLGADAYYLGLGVLLRDTILQHTAGGQTIVPQDLSIFESLALCVQNRWPSLLVGPSGCGKSTVLQKLAAFSGARLIEIALNADTDAMDLIGGFEQRDNFRQLTMLVDELTDLLQYYIVLHFSSAQHTGVGEGLIKLYGLVNNFPLQLDQISRSLDVISARHKDERFQQLRGRCVQILETNDDNSVGFEWTAGLLIHAIQRGDWVVLDNANLCNPTVLDRLNSLMEPDGCLIINEQRTPDGAAQVIKPHPKFRLFLTMDPKYGELSRAMRNRSVEICFLADKVTVPPEPIIYGCDSEIYRLRNCNIGSNGRKDINDIQIEIAVDHLSPIDIARINESLVSKPNLWPSGGQMTIEFLLSVLSRYSNLLKDHSLVGWSKDAILDEANAANMFLDQGQPIEPVHPLINEIRQLKSPTGPSESFLLRLSKLQEIQLETARLCQELCRIQHLARGKRSLEMNRLERSMTSNSVISHRKDSTSHLADFLISSCQLLTEQCRDLDSMLSDGSGINISTAILQFCRDILRFALRPDFEDAIFLTFIESGRQILRHFRQDHIPFFKSWSQALESFQATWSLNTGQSMQRLWDNWRPATVSESARLSQLIELEHLCLRFDGMVQATNVDLAQLSQISNSLARAQTSLLLGADARQLITELTHTIEYLAEKIGHPSVCGKAYFASEFEALCQYYDLTSAHETQSPLLGMMQLLAGRPSKPPNFSPIDNMVPRLLSDMSRFSGSHDTSIDAFALRGNFSLSLIRKIHNIGDVPLGRMKFLYTEIEVLTKAIASTSGHIVQNQFAALGKHIRNVIKGYLVSHQDLIIPTSFKEINCPLWPATAENRTIGLCDPSENASNPDFSAFVTKMLSPCLADLSQHQPGLSSSLNYGRVLVRLAMTLLRSFIPDRPYDPSLSIAVETERHSSRMFEGNRKLSALKSFEAHYSGRETNLRIRALEDELRKLGPGPSQPPITRPKPSQLNILQGELMNIVNSIFSKSAEDILLHCEGGMDDPGTRLLQQNIRRLCDRLSEQYRAYDDLTILIIHFLHLLGLGINLVQSSHRIPTDQQKLLDYFGQITPFIGNSSMTASQLQPNDSSRSLQQRPEVDLYRLSVISNSQNIDAETLQGSQHREILRDCLQRLFEQWKEQLVSEQAKEAEKSALFRYRGSAEDESAADTDEMLHMFPTFDEGLEDSGATSTGFESKNITSAVSKVLKELFRGDDKESRLKKLIRHALQLMGPLVVENTTTVIPSGPKCHLSAVLLSLEEEQSSLSNPLYNFYTDPNLREVEQLADLVEKIRLRFVEIQKSWPEHATLADVITCCSEIYQFKHREPIAKFLTKAEKLHGYVYEWQSVASREFSATEVYNQLTALLITWRRLELSTWARLLDLEKERCEEDAGGWWFVTYEVMIASPLQMIHDNQELTAHVRELLTILEKFLGSVSIGQYRSRLQLVERFNSLLQLYAEDFPSLSQVVSGVSNLIDHYSPFVPIFEERLTKGRKTLEKGIQQEVLLTSWKDTNITALRESARRSHHKLFKVVRKYRALLGQPSDGVIAGGLPPLASSLQPVAQYPQQSQHGSEMILSAALDICRQSGLNWESKPARFREPIGAAKSMCSLYESSFSGLNLVRELDDFSSDIVHSIDDFRKRTPQTFSEENKDELQHLKVQKRRFYAEKLRELRHMGIRSNLGTDILERQSSTASILAATSNISTSEQFQHIDSATSYFHRLLDLMPKVRQAGREYSEDLSNVEAGRSAGFVEGLLQRILKERSVINPLLKAFSCLQSLFQEMDNFSCLGDDELSINSAMANDRKNLLASIRWLSVIIGLCKTVLNTHAKHSGADLTQVHKELDSMKVRLENSNTALQNLRNLPQGLSSASHDTQLLVAHNLIREINGAVQRLCEHNPSVAFALDNIIPWTKATSPGNTASTTDVAAPIPLKEFDNLLQSAADKIFVSLQRISKVLLDLPESTEHSGWLSESESVLRRALGELHMDNIINGITLVLHKIQHIASTTSGSLKAAAAVTSIILPILNQYRSICHDLMHRYISLHREECKMGYLLSSSFVRIASDGFCGPRESSGEQGADAKLESGTGLGDGEGAEDISKDVQDDEDLSELAQQQPEQNGEKEDMEAAEDAVNMDHEDLEAEATESGQKETDENGGEAESEHDNVDEEVGSVDDWDQEAVDEKLWDGENNPDQKDTENEAGQGSTDKDEEAAAHQNKNEETKEGPEGEAPNADEAPEEPDDEAEAVGREDMGVTEPTLKEEEVLDLPDDMELDDQEKGGLSDLDDGLDEDLPDNMSVEENEPEPEPEENMQDSVDIPQEEEAKGDALDDQSMQEDNPAENPSESETQPEAPNPNDRSTGEPENNQEQPEVAPSEAVSAGLDQQQNEDKGDSGEAVAEQISNEQADNRENLASAAEGGEDGKASGTQAGGKAEDAVEDRQTEAFKKLGDILEQWHRSQRKIKEAPQDTEVEHQNRNGDMEEVDFEHLANDDDLADTQALGQADEEQVTSIDQNKGIESNNPPGDAEILPDADDLEPPEQGGSTLEDLMELDQPTGQEEQKANLPLSIINTQGENMSYEADGQPEMQENVEDMDRHLSAINLTTDLPPLTSPDEARRLWSHYESITHDLALSLTEQLRLILAPTMATKLRGDFRTGKRLNIKRIIPYIASQYKRDKIWMRRSVPSKRNYQIMLAVDDSKSMLESASGQLAFETLALVSRSLSMLEAGDLCVVSFGNEDHIRVAHEFGKPFSSETGTQVFQQFSFKQTGTNMKRLVQQSMTLFRDARARRSSNNNDLWQLQLIISDGICEDHDDIRRLLRQAQEERIMIVFVVVDATKEESGSIMNLTQATFEADDSGIGGGKWKMKRYLEGFPFPYYLIVRNVQELPSVLSLALKQWFSEVVEVTA